MKKLNGRWAVVQHGFKLQNLNYFIKYNQSFKCELYLSFSNLIRFNMSDKQLRKIRGVWCKFNNQDKMSTVTLDEIRTCCIERGIEIIEIEEYSFGFNLSIPAIKITIVNNLTALLPRQKLSEIPIYQNNIIPFQKEEEFWAKVDWFPPVFIIREKINRGFKVANYQVNMENNLRTKQLQERFKEFFPTVYDFSNIIPITVQTLPESIAISKHVPLIKESILAFYSGMRTTAVASLIPIIEDILNAIIEDPSNDLDLKSKVDKCIERARENIKQDHISGVDWIPEEYIQINVLKVMNERIRVIEFIGNWLKNSFYEKTDKYQNTSGFNRHFFAHAKSEIWQNPSNFFRAMGLIQALAFIECFALKDSKVSIIPPRPDIRTESFHNEVIACINMQIIKKNILQQSQIKNCLPFNITSSDDGWLSHSAMLLSKMNDEIVKQLRDNGWQCYSFGEPIKKGEYITIQASKNEKTIGVALLYCCATSNEIYKELEKTMDFILYMGPPYRQSSYAQGIKCHVGPLNAWLAPN